MEISEIYEGLSYEELDKKTGKMVVKEIRPPVHVAKLTMSSWNNINYLEQLELPEDDRNIIVTVHYYSPMEFTHQDASCAGNRDKIGVEWNATPEEKQAVIRDFGKAQVWSEKHDRCYSSVSLAYMTRRIWIRAFAT